NQGQPFQAFVIRRMKDDFLLEAGYGIVVNPRGSYADWVFSYGDIVNFHLTGEFYTSVNTPEANDGEFLNGEVSVSDVHEKYLPKQTRSVIREFLRSQGVQQPKALLLSNNIQGTKLERIAFDIYPNNFPTNRHFDFAMNHIAWFLPRHYKIINLSAAN